MELRVLGTLDVLGVAGDAPPTRGRERAVLAALALEIDRVVSTRMLADALWPGDDDDHASGIKTHVMRLRKAIGPAAIDTTAGGYRLVRRAVTLDADSFDHAISACTAPGSAMPAAHRIETLDAALARWRGRPYDDLDDWGPAVRERLRLEELREVGLEARSDAALEVGTATVAELEQLVGDQPLRERRWAQLMLGLYRAGRQAEALRAFGRARELLRDQLGIDPGRELVDLERAILDHAAWLDQPATNGLDGGRGAGLVEAPGATPLSADVAFERGERRLLAGDPRSALEAFLEAADVARQIGDTTRLLRSAVGASGEGWNSGLDPHAPHVQLLEEAARVPASYSPLRAQVLARLAVAKSYQEPTDVNRARAVEALDLARLTGDRRALALALEANLIVERDPARLDQRLAWADELDDLVEPPDDGRVTPWATLVWARAGIEAAHGELDRAIETLRAIDEEPRAANHPLARMIASEASVIDATRRGDWDAALDGLVVLRDAGAAALIDPAAAMLAHEGALAMIATLQGSVHDLSGFALATFPVTSGEVMLVAGSARSRAERSAGIDVLSRIGPDVLAPLPRDLLWPAMVWSVTEAAHELGAADVAAALYEATRPFHWLSVVNPGGIYLGSMEHHLGMLAATFGQPDLARRHLGVAVEVHRAGGATEWVRRSELQLADLPE